MSMGPVVFAKILCDVVDRASHLLAKDAEELGRVASDPHPLLQHLVQADLHLDKQGHAGKVSRDEGRQRQHTRQMQ